jgi:hypothetical protein
MVAACLTASRPSSTRGKETRYRVRVSPEVTLLVSSPTPNGIGVGDRVGVEWDEHSLRLLDHEALL